MWIKYDRIHQLNISDETDCSCQLSDRYIIGSLVCLSQTALADRERDLAELVTKVEQLQLARERQALKTAEMEKTVEALTQQRDARDSAAAEAASQLSDDVRTLRLALDETSRRERQVIAANVNTVISIFDHDNKPKDGDTTQPIFIAKGTAWNTNTQINCTQTYEIVKSD